MSEPTHTPGPWRKSPNHAVVTKSNGHKIRQDRPAGAAAVCGVWESIEDQLQADARLIAAAPELLEALEACRMHIETLERMHDHELPEGEMLRTAIAKAKGEGDE